MILDSVVIGPLGPGATFVYTFPQKIAPPDVVMPMINTTIAVSGAPTTNSVTFINNGLGVQTATFYLEFYFNELGRGLGDPAFTWQG